VQNSAGTAPLQWTNSSLTISILEIMKKKTTKERYPLKQVEKFLKKYFILFL
jgi:hypothetical protein|tara:strand:- start:400 stop:555 length:156 start_codon:yes stop_codon:yes gene_type:complete